MIAILKFSLIFFCKTKSQNMFKSGRDFAVSEIVWMFYGMLGSIAPSFIDASGGLFVKLCMLLAVSGAARAVCLKIKKTLFQGFYRG